MSWTGHRGPYDTTLAIGKPKAKKPVRLCACGAGLLANQRKYCAPCGATALERTNRAALERYNAKKRAAQP